ncbi:MAG TPA: 30S ribosomal protein S18 [Bacillota bacterium]|jgi:small subunit ribosomal protein S18|nr:30S ribosomal protein S18 [Fastidiosipila sp.]HPX93717.1 30S ribosomal protein S18 [Bacillota bacterium]HQB81465.1 30S ribosomal protein S18 [Bacillota bacterium]
MADTKKRGSYQSQKRYGRKKYCVFCADHVDVIDYKDVNTLQRYLAENYKILPRRMTGTCARHQRALTRAILRSRQVALIPYKAE